MSYAIWSLALLVVISLWAVAMSEIGVHLRRGMFSSTRLATMAAVVSAVAIATIFAASITFPGAPTRADAPTVGTLAEPGCTKGIRGAFVFSFGLERGLQAPYECPAGRPQN